MIEHARDSAARYMDMSGRDIAAALLDSADRANLEDASLYREAAARLTCPPPKKDPTKVFVTIEVDTSKVDAAMEKVKELQALALETLDYMAALDAAITNFRAPAKRCKRFQG